MEQNLQNRLQGALIKYKDQVAIEYKKDNIWKGLSYKAFKQQAEAVSSYLKIAGVAQDDKIAVLLPNQPEWPIIFFGTISCGAIVVPVSLETDFQEVENILKDSQPKVVFVNNSSFLLKNGILNKYPFIKKVISVESDEFDNAIRTSAKSYSNVKIDAEDVACILYTSGTTDTPKGVMLTHKNLLSNCDSINNLRILKKTDSIVSVLPLHHAFPLTITMILPLLNGLKIIYPQNASSEALSEAMQQTNPTIFVAVPQIFYLFHQRIKEQLRKIPFPVNSVLKIIVELLYRIRDITKVNLSQYLFFRLHRRFGKAMRLFISGGAKLDEEVEGDLFRFGFVVLEGYGLTETAPCLTLNPLEAPKIGSVGLPIPGVELRIKDQNEQGIGEIIVRGQNIMKGYYKRDDLTAEIIKEGWFYTGDLGFLDGDGYLFITGRSKEMIVLSSGVNIAPDEIEQVYARCAPVKEMCVFEAAAKVGIKKRQVLWAIIVPDLEYFKRFGEVNLRIVFKERFDNVSRTLPAHKRIMGFSITLEPLPRTLLGKMQRFAIREKYAPKIKTEKEFGSPLKKEPSPEDLQLIETATGRKVIEYLKHQTKATQPIYPDNLLELDLGIDSLGRIELTSGLEKTLNIQINTEIIGKAFTVGDLIVGINALFEKGAQVLSEEKQQITTGLDYWRKLFEVLPEKENTEKIDLHPGFGAWLAGVFFVGFFYLFFTLLYRLKVKGQDNIPKKGPYILYANHASYYDGLIIASAVPRLARLNLFFLGFRPYFNVPVIRNLIKIGRIIPLDFSTHLLEALRSCYYVLKNGKNLCLFPEGIRSLDGNINEFKKGFGILVKESKPKLIPVLIEGAFEAWPRTSKFPRRYPIRIKFGEALSAQELEKKGFRLGTKDSYEAICLACRKALIDLKEKTFD